MDPHGSFGLRRGRRRTSPARGKEDLPRREDYPGRSRGASRAELSFGTSQKAFESLPFHRIATKPKAKAQSNNSGATPPAPICPPPDREKELPPTGGAKGAHGCGTSFEGPSVPFEEESGNPPVMASKTLVTAFWMVPTALLTAPSKPVKGRGAAPPAETTGTVGSDDARGFAGLAAEDEGLICAA